MQYPDVRIHGGSAPCSVYRFELLTPEALEWVEENVELEPWQWLGASSFGVEHRFAAALAEGMLEAGLEVE